MMGARCEGRAGKGGKMWGVTQFEGEGERKGEQGGTRGIVMGVVSVENVVCAVFAVLVLSWFFFLGDFFLDSYYFLDC